MAVRVLLMVLFLVLLEVKQVLEVFALRMVDYLHQILMAHIIQEERADLLELR
jgi:hypothetical protein